ncbi:LPS assembly lipoprotein LptE [Massilia sp. CCM 9210]|uniref:LPS-assembly lipoprotein LptE n=1 Tax=Massilia scottii TaxID=3057166 RepID=UPI002796A8A7|nr:LPS assembly lipoprotein LptE [Massilia sp. CCM 9210]MDQ1815756.1 LPS assembly lipoprotein LptE [Massilia sp. CCM 9210]
MTILRSATVLRTVCALVLLASLSACGFQLRGSNGQFNMPFRSIYLAFPETSALGTELKRNLRGGDAVQVLTDASKAETLFDVLSETRGKQILSLNAQGRVREYLLTYTLVFRLRDANGAELLPATEISLKRSITFDETQVLGKESEEVLLYRDMQTDLVQQVLRRLVAVKPT